MNLRVPLILFKKNLNENQKLYKYSQINQKLYVLINGKNHKRWLKNNWKYQETSVEFFFFMKQPYALIKGNKKVIPNTEWMKKPEKKTMTKETGQNYINTLISWSWAYD